MNNEEKKTLGIIGFGRFGVLVATVLSDFFEIKVYHHREKESDLTIAAKIGASLVSFEETVHCDFLILSAPISQTEELIKRVAKVIKPGTTVIDTCSVKKLPCKWLEQYIPEDNFTLGAHPMFGPVTTKFDLDQKHFELEGKQIVLCPLRISKDQFTAILDFLEKLKLEVIIVTPEEHDKQNARTLSFVHFLGRSLTEAGIGKQEIFTPGYADILKILPHTNNDDWQLFYDMNNYNPYAEEIRQEFLDACETIEKKVIKADSKDEFDFNRKMINKIDGKIFALLEKRMRCAGEIGKYKKKNNLAVVDPEREKQIVKNIDLNTDLNIDFIEKVYGVIFEESYKQQ